LVFGIGGRGDKSFNDSAAAGFDKAIRDFNLSAKELVPSSGGENRGDLLQQLATQGYGLNVAVGFLLAPSVCQIAGQYPDVNFADVDGFIDHSTCVGAADLSDSSNVTSILFAEQEGSYLMGAAAALKSKSGHVGFIGGVESDLIKRYLAGYEAGARKINPDIVIEVKYVSRPPDLTGFDDPAKAKEIATRMYEGGADVVDNGAGGSGEGLFEAARDYSTANGTHVWAIGFDSDQYQSAAADLQPYILTSMVKQLDVAVYAVIKEFAETGTIKGGYRMFDLRLGGIGYAASGHFVDDIKSQLDDLMAEIIAGTIVVPTAPMPALAGGQ
jgi:basic membrane protein A